MAQYREELFQNIDHWTAKQKSLRGIAAIDLMDRVYVLEHGTNLPFIDFYVYIPGTRQRETIRDAFLNDHYSVGDILDLLLDREVYYTNVRSIRYMEHVISIPKLSIDVGADHVLTYEKKPNSILRVINECQMVAATVVDMTDKLLVDLGGASTLRAVTLDEIKDENGNSVKTYVSTWPCTWKDFEGILNDVKHKLWFVAGQEIKTFYINQVVATETKVAEEKIDAKFDVVLDSAFVDEYGTSYSVGDVSASADKVDKTFGEMEFTTKDESTANGIVKTPIIKVKNYQAIDPADPNAKYVKLKLKGTTEPILIEKSKITGTMTVGGIVQVEVNGIKVDTEPLTDEEVAVAYADKLAYQPTTNNFDEAKTTHIRLKSDVYVEESKVVAPISYKAILEADVPARYATTDTFAVLDDSVSPAVWTVVTKTEFEAKYTQNDLIDPTSANYGKVKALEECSFNDAPEFVQITNKTGEKKIIKQIATVKDMEDCRKSFVSSYSKGEYELDHVWIDDGTGTYVSHEIKPGRYELTNEVEIEDRTVTKSPFNSIVDKNIQFKVDPKTGCITNFKGGSELSEKEINKNYYKKLASICSLTFVGMVTNPLLAIAAAPIIAAGGVVAATMAVFGPIINKIRMWSQKRTSEKDRLRATQEDIAKNHVKNAYDKINLLVSEGSVTLSEEYILNEIAKIENEMDATLSASNYDDSLKRDKDGKIVITPQNSARARQFQRELKTDRKSVTWAETKGDSFFVRIGKRIRGESLQGRLERTNKVLRKALEQMVKAHNKIAGVTPITDLESLSDADINTIRARLGSTHAKVVAYDTAKTNADNAQKELDDKLKEYERPSGEAEYPEKEAAMQKVENLKIYYLLQLDPTYASAVAFDAETGRLFVGKYELIKQGDKFITVDTTVNNNYFSRSEKHIKSLVLSGIAVDPLILDDVLNYDDLTAIPPRIALINKKGVATNNNNTVSISEEILDYILIGNEYTQVKDLVDAIAAIKSSSSPSVDISAIANPEVQTAVKDGKLTPNMTALIANMLAYKDSLDKKTFAVGSAEQILKDKILYLVADADYKDVNANLAVAHEKHLIFELETFVSTHLEKAEDYIAALDQSIISVRAGGTINPLVVNADVLAGKPDSINAHLVAIDALNNNHSQYDALAVFAALDARIKSVVGYDFATKFGELKEVAIDKEMLEADIKMDDIDNYFTRIAIVINKKGVGLTPAEAAVENDLTSGTMDATIAALFIDIKNLQLKKGYPGYAKHAGMFDRINKVLGYDFMAKSNEYKMAKQHEADKKKEFEDLVKEIKRFVNVKAVTALSKDELQGRKDYLTEALVKLHAKFAKLNDADKLAVQTLIAEIENYLNDVEVEINNRKAIVDNELIQIKEIKTKVEDQKNIIDSILTKPINLLTTTEISTITTAYAQIGSLENAFKIHRDALKNETDASVTLIIDGCASSIQKAKAAYNTKKYIAISSQITTLRSIIVRMNPLYSVDLKALKDAVMDASYDPKHKAADLNKLKDLKAKMKKIIKEIKNLDIVKNLTDIADPDKSDIQNELDIANQIETDFNIDADLVDAKLGSLVSVVEDKNAQAIHSERELYKELKAGNPKLYEQLRAVFVEPFATTDDEKKLLEKELQKVVDYVCNRIDEKHALTPPLPAIKGLKKDGVARKLIIEGTTFLGKSIDLSSIA